MDANLVCAATLISEPGRSWNSSCSDILLSEVPSRGERLLLSCPVAARIWGHEAWSLEKAWWPCSYFCVIIAKESGSRWLPKAHWPANPAKKQASSLVRDSILKAIRQSDRGRPISALLLASPMYVMCVCAHPHQIHTHTKIKSKRQGKGNLSIHCNTKQQQQKFFSCVDITFCGLSNEWECHQVGAN